MTEKFTLKPLESFTIQDARTKACSYAPYLRTLIMGMPIVTTMRVPTMGVDKHWRLYVNPVFLSKLTLGQAASAVVHEAVHIMQKCHERAAVMIGTSSIFCEAFERWNIAADFADNIIVRGIVSAASGSKSSDGGLPPGCCWPAEFGLPEDWQIEQYYANMPQKAMDKFASSAGEHGSSVDGIAKGWELGNPDPSSEDTAKASGFSKQRQEAAMREVARDIEQASTRNAGSVPSDLVRVARDILRPRVDPIAEIASAVRNATLRARGYGRTDWNREHRRNPSREFIMPSRCKSYPVVYVFVDTSGSMDDRDLALALGAIDRGLQGIPQGMVKVASGDTEMHVCKSVMSATDVQLIGGGGTDMAKAISDCCEQRPRPEAIVILTDGETGWPSEPCRPVVMAALTRKPSRMPPSWIKTVMMETVDE